MRNIYLFVRRYFNFICFLLLQGFCIYLIVHYSRYHNALFTNTANQVTGAINEQYDKVEYYFQLKRTNDSLVLANERLYNKLKADYLLPDTVSHLVIDSIKVDSTLQRRQFLYMPVKVVSSSVSAQNNYVVIRKRGQQNLRKDMGVIDVNNAVIGLITEVSNDYAVVTSLIHKADSRIDGKLKKTGERGTISWDGKMPNILVMTELPQSAKMAVGDTVMTSGLSNGLPRDLLIGTVLSVAPDPATSKLRVRLRSSANFYNLEYAYVIDNNQQQEIDKLLDKVKKKTQ